MYAVPFTHNNLDFSEDVKHLADLGFEQISVEPVVTDPKEPYALRPEDVPQLLEEYDKLAVELLKRQKEGRGVNFFHFMIDLSGGPCVAKRLSGCGSGTEYLAVTPWGDFYPCHQFVGNEKFLMGNVDEGIVRPDIVDEFKCCNVYAKEKCRSCFAKFYCSGGCAANSYNCHGKIDDVYELGCELQKKRVECAIMIKSGTGRRRRIRSTQNEQEERHHYTCLCDRVSAGRTWTAVFGLDSAKTGPLQTLSRDLIWQAA